MKKIIALLLSALVLLSLVACDSTPSGNGTNVVPNSASSTQSDSSLSEKDVPKVSEGSDTTDSDPQSTTPVGNANPTPPKATEIPAYSGQIFIQLNNNVPSFSAQELTTEAYEKYEQLDALGRVTKATASLGKDTMPKEGEKRGDISKIKPTGWVQKQYDSVNGKYLYNRCHLIGWQLSAENDNKCNLLTGTRHFNTEGMLPFENMVADYIKETDNHVAYRVTPIFEGDNLLCLGVQIEAYSVEDSGEGICFNVFCYNVEPDINIDYATGDSSSAKNTSPPPDTDTAPTPSAPTENQAETVWIPTKGGKKYHKKASCSNMIDPDEVTKQEAINLGFDPCGRCYK